MNAPAAALTPNRIMFGAASARAYRQADGGRPYYPDLQARSADVAFATARSRNGVNATRRNASAGTPGAEPAVPPALRA
jgi:hypothetical protein